ncbi:DUF4232 domain-containing protein [Streptomyces sp. BBFR109]|uniref:DUF4232 domain-containing protein n=1 Tax=Streptomyces sp. BBFR109 TaxID=3448172 RepID=UPI003F77296A
MRRAPLPLALPAAVALAGALLLTACGTQRAGAQDPGPASPHASATSGESCGASATPGGRSATDDAGPDTSTPGQAAPDGSSGGTATAREGVELVGPAGCPVLEITNHTAGAATYTVTYFLLSDTGTALTSAQTTVAAVEPGRTVRRAVSLTDVGTLPGDAGKPTKVRIIKVRSVPSAEAPSETGHCPASGVRVYADRGDAAMGLRVVGLHLVNCGAHTYHLDGYPQLQLFDEEHKPVEGVRILHGGGAIALGTGADDTPRPLALRPGEGAHAGLVWRNTTEMGEPVNAPYVRVVAKPGAAAVTVTPELDLGTTGKLGVGAWQRDDASR